MISLLATTVFGFNSTETSYAMNARCSGCGLIKNQNELCSCGDKFEQCWTCQREKLQGTECDCDYFATKCPGCGATKSKNTLCSCGYSSVLSQCDFFTSSDDLVDVKTLANNESVDLMGLETIQDFAVGGFGSNSGTSAFVGTPVLAIIPETVFNLPIFLFDKADPDYSNYSYNYAQPLRCDTSQRYFYYMGKEYGFYVSLTGYTEISGKTEAKYLIVILDFDFSYYNQKSEYNFSTTPLCHFQFCYEVGTPRTEIPYSIEEVSYDVCYLEEMQTMATVFSQAESTSMSTAPIIDQTRVNYRGQREKIEKKEEASVLKNMMGVCEFIAPTIVEPIALIGTAIDGIDLIFTFLEPFIQRRVYVTEEFNNEVNIATLPNRVYQIKTNNLIQRVIARDCVKENSNGGLESLRYKINRLKSSANINETYNYYETVVKVNSLEEFKCSFHKEFNLVINGNIIPLKQDFDAYVSGNYYTDVTKIYTSSYSYATGNTKYVAPSTPPVSNPPANPPTNPPSSSGSRCTGCGSTNTGVIAAFTFKCFQCNKVWGVH